MKKLLHVAIIFGLFFTSALSASTASDKSLNKLMDLSGIRKQMNEYPAIVKAGMGQAMTKSETKEISKEEFIAMNDAVDKVYKPSKLIGTIRQGVKDKLSQEDVDKLLAWYTSKLGKKITKAEEDASTPESYAYMMTNYKTIMQDKKKVFFAKQIDKLLHVSQMVAQLQKNSSISIYSAMNNPTKSEMTIFRSQLASQKKLMLATSRQMVTLSFAYSYRNIDEEDLKTYMSFLKQRYTKKFNDAAMNAMVESLNKSTAEMAKSFAKITK